MEEFGGPEVLRLAEVSDLMPARTPSAVLARIEREGGLFRTKLVP
jgi:hypothetical protein